MSYSWGNDTSYGWSGGSGFTYGSAKKAYNTKAYSSTKDNMKTAYNLSAIVMNAALTDTEKVLIGDLRKKDILVVPGIYDSVEKVLDQTNTPYTKVTRRTELDPEQIVLINCAGNNLKFSYKGSKDLDALRKFVDDGGFVVSTDWALESCIMKAFPGYIGRGEIDTSDDVVEVDLVASGSPYTKGLGEGALKPIWWLESSSYPIELLRNKDVDVLLASDEMKERYEHSPVAVKFPVGEGRVVHVTSHFYLQTAKSKYDAQQAKTGLDFATEFVGMAKGDASQIEKELKSVSFGALESAYTSVRFLHNVFLEKQRRRAGLEEKLLGDPKEIKLLGTQSAKSMLKLPPGGKKTKKLGP